VPERLDLFLQSDRVGVLRAEDPQADVERLREVEPVESLPFVLQAVATARAQLQPHIPLIGFAGAPFTLASYMIEGGGSRDYVRTKTFMYTQPEAWHALLGCLSRNLVRYLNGQMAAGAQVVQLFDSWVGTLSPTDYRTFVFPHTQAVLANLTPGVPVIHFGTGTSALLELMREAGGDVIGVDFRVELDHAWQRLGDVSIQGNLDPAVLFADPGTICGSVSSVFAAGRGRPGTFLT
jgi:uroporphyrinogen decarboxylase